MIDNKSTNLNNKNINLGIQILRMILCFWVLCFHCLAKKKINYFLFYITKTKFFHVPCFAFMSFYFSSKIFINRNIIKLKNRLERLLIPYILWPSIIFIIHNIIHKRKLSFNLLKLQLLLGRRYLVPIYYLFSIIFITTLLFMISLFFKNHFLLILLVVMYLSYIGEYTIFNHKLFLNNYRNYIRMPIIDTISFFPLSCLGIIFASSNLMIFFKSNLKSSLFLSYLFIYFIFKYNTFVDIGGYNGIKYIFSSISFFVAFYLLPLEKIYILFQKIIKQITSYTNGIYCLHARMINLVKVYIHHKRDFKFCIIIYLLSYLISFIGIKIFGRYKLKYLFI